MTSPTPKTDAFQIRQINCLPMSHPIDNGPSSSLVQMSQRNALLIEVTDVDGARGWGEVWCNFPPRGNVSRMHLLEDVIAPVLYGRKFDAPFQVQAFLRERLSTLIIHTGEYGAFEACVAGLDIALWDMIARRSCVPLCKALAEDSQNTVNCYASTLRRTDPAEHARELLEDGHTVLKLKVGFGDDEDRSHVTQVREAVGDDLPVGIDANQCWSAESALQALQRLSSARLEFVEEPISAHAPISDWKRLKDEAGVQIAAGENIQSLDDFTFRIENEILDVFQPDVAKWGGVSGLMHVGALLDNAPGAFYPHYMGSAVGLAATIHVLAALQSEGRLELDANANPFRTRISDLDLTVQNGQIAVPIGTGLGIELDPDMLNRYRVN